MTMSFNEKSGGFTLLELLLAIFIFSIVISSIYGAYTATFRVAKSAEFETEVQHRARIALERITEDLKATLQGTNGEMVGESQDIDGRRADTLAFKTLSHINFNQEIDDPHLATVKYVVESDEGTGLFRLYRADVTWLPGVTVDQDLKGFLLCDKLWEVQFLYTNDQDEEDDSWDAVAAALGSPTGSGKQFPKMIQVSLRFANSTGDGEGTLFTTGVALGRM